MKYHSLLKKETNRSIAESLTDDSHRLPIKLTSFKEWMLKQKELEELSAMNEGSTGDDHDCADWKIHPPIKPVPKEFQRPKDPKKDKP